MMIRKLQGTLIPEKNGEELKKRVTKALYAHPATQPFVFQSKWDDNGMHINILLPTITDNDFEYWCQLLNAILQLKEFQECNFNGNLILIMEEVGLIPFITLFNIRKGKISYQTLEHSWPKTSSPPQSKDINSWEELEWNFFRGILTPSANVVVTSDDKSAVYRVLYQDETYPVFALQPWDERGLVVDFWSVSNEFNIVEFVSGLTQALKTESVVNLQLSGELVITSRGTGGIPNIFWISVENGNVFCRKAHAEWSDEQSL